MSSCGQNLIQSVAGGRWILWEFYFDFLLLNGSCSADLRQVGRISTYGNPLHAPHCSLKFAIIREDRHPIFFSKSSRNCTAPSRSRSSSR